MLRRTGLVIAVLSAVFLALDVATRAVPPWLSAFLWLAVGVNMTNLTMAGGEPDRLFLGCS